MNKFEAIVGGCGFACWLAAGALSLFNSPLWVPFHGHIQTILAIAGLVLIGISAIASDEFWT